MSAGKGPVMPTIHLLQTETLFDSRDLCQNSYNLDPKKPNRRILLNIKCNLGLKIRSSSWRSFFGTKSLRFHPLPLAPPLSCMVVDICRGNAFFCTTYLITYRPSLFPGSKHGSCICCSCRQGRKPATVAIDIWFLSTFTNGVSDFQFMIFMEFLCVCHVFYDLQFSLNCLWFKLAIRDFNSYRYFWQHGNKEEIGSSKAWKLGHLSD